MQHAARKRHGGLDGQGLDTVAVIGYTNTVGGLNLIRAFALEIANAKCEENLTFQAQKSLQFYM